jgi:DMSO/TMAO reductase YedYZ molybdopterin-dependent catalytic subunit
MERSKPFAGEEATMQDRNRQDSQIGRRTFLRGVAATSAAVASTNRCLCAADADAGSAGPAGLIARQKNPDNLEFPFSTLDSFLTPNNLFYVRSHFDVPKLETNTWRLKVEGAVEQLLELSYEDLRGMRSRTVTALLECSGNSRVFLSPSEAGVQWELGGVSNAEWTGVPLSAVLERARLKSSSVEVVLEGADNGQYREPAPKTPGVISYARSLPLSKAMKPEVLLAYRMNGRELPPAHGFPVRAVVPGWYGMASVKWLARIIVSEGLFKGYFQTFAYSIWDRRHGLPTLVPVTQLQVKAEMARPASREVVPADSHYRVHGAAWAGEANVAKVEFSDDGGKSWAATKLLGEVVPYAWRFWEYSWRTPSPGRRTLMVRATDSRGHIQPMKRDPDLRDAMISHVLPTEIELV